MSIGAFTVVAIVDGVSNLPPSMYPGADSSGAYAHLLDGTGTYRIPVGAYLVRGPGGTLLVDAGAGPHVFPFPSELAEAAGLTNPPQNLLDSGRLPQSLADEATDPAAITAVYLTHLHLDHVGWLMKDGAPFFPNATVYYGAEDWAPLITAAEPGDPAKAILEAARAAGVLRPYGGDDVELLPGVRAVRTPGHTPGQLRGAAGVERRATLVHG